MNNDDIPSIFSLGLSRFFVGLVLFFALVRTEFGLAIPAAGVLIIIYGTRLWSRLGAARLRLSFSPDRDRLFPGEIITLEAELENDKILPVWVRLELASPEYLSPDEPLEGETRLLAREKRTRVWRLTARRRGVFPLGPARLFAGDLLGLHRRLKVFGGVREVIVFPRLLPLKRMDIPFREYFGIHASKGPVDDPAWYTGTRDYTGNRPARNIHWKASARLGVLQEKLYEPTSHRKVLFVLDFAGLAGEYPGEPSRDFEPMIETTATLAAALMETGASFALVANTRLTGGGTPLLPMGRGPEHLGTFLEMLARIEPAAEGDLAVLLRESDPDHTGLVYLGPAPGEGVRSLLFSSSAHRRRRMYFVFAGEESPGASDPPAVFLWEGYPSCPFREVVDVPKV